MYNRLMSNRRGYNDAYLKGVDEFVSYVKKQICPMEKEDVLILSAKI